MLVDVEGEALVRHLRAARTVGPHRTGRRSTASEPRAVRPPADSRRARTAAGASVGLAGAAALCGARESEAETPDHSAVASVACVRLGVTREVCHEAERLAGGLRVWHRLGRAVGAPPRVATAASCCAGCEPHEPRESPRHGRTSSVGEQSRTAVSKISVHAKAELDSARTGHGHECDKRMDVAVGQVRGSRVGRV